jgi:molybdopterin molybdotransferase
MISVQEAKELILKEVKASPAIGVPLADALHRVLARDLRTPIPLPLADNSAMDGFAVKSRDTAAAAPETPIALRVAGVQRAGDSVSKKLRSGEAIRIMTGATLPPGTDAVLMKELAAEKSGRIFISGAVPFGANIRRKGEEVQKGDLIFPAGTVLDSRAIGLLANLGLNSIPVRRPPRIAVIVTGSELLAPGARLRRGKIYDSNTPMLLAALRELHLTPLCVERVRDDAPRIRNALKKSFQKADVVLLVGGVSVGDYDFSKSALARLGVKTLFWKVAQKPGKPLFFGKRGKTLVFGLPGNPVSVWTCFHEYVRPALASWEGKNPTPISENALLENPIKAHPTLTVFLRGFARGPATRDDRRVRVFEKQGSHQLKSLAEANCLVRVPPQAKMVPSGARVEIQTLLGEKR